MDGLLFYMMLIFPFLLIITVVLVLLFIELPMVIIKKFKSGLYQRIKPKIWIAYLIVVLLFITISVWIIYELNHPTHYVF
jgi:hypothetical protein